VDALDTHPDYNGDGEDSKTAVVYAARYGRIDMLKFLLNARADITSYFGSRQFKLALKCATRRGHDATAKFLQYHQIH
jgi:ankyrin repeat protein